jgi:very-short-patch-repair endonuclease
MAAVLACGEGAALSHLDAGALYGIVEVSAPPHATTSSSAARGRVIEISLPYTRRRALPGIAIRRRSWITRADVTLRHGIPVTTPVPTLIDLATRLDRNKLETSINEADKRDLIDPESLRAALDSIPKRPGVGVLRGLLDRRTFTLTDSQLERYFLPIAREAGLGPPLTQQWVNGFRVDFYWPELGLVVETDGLRYHRTPAQQARDRIRDQSHTAAGVTPLRFTRAQVRFDREYVRTTLARTVARLRRS